MCEKCLFKDVCKDSNELPFECSIFEKETEYHKGYSKDLRAFTLKVRKE
jgi:hypothetical protein